MEKLSKKIDWVIHYVAPTVDRSQSPDYFYEPYFSCIHTHGLDNHGHRELCLSIALDYSVACALLNSMSQRIADGETVFTEGIRTDVLANGMDVQFISFDNDPTLYVILPDANGKLPMDSNCEEPFCYQETYAKFISDNREYI